MSTIARDPLGTDTVPVGPGMSMFDPMFIGIDEFGHHVSLDIVYHNLLIAGEPGGGKSGLINLTASHAALSDNTRLVLLDAKFVELGPWRDIADAFIGDKIEQALSVLRRLLLVASNRYRWLLANRRRKLTRDDDLSVIVTIIDELAMYSTVLGTKDQREEFSTLLRGLVSLGRACAHAGHRRHPTPLLGHHPRQPAGPVRLPRRVPLHHRRLLRRHPRRRLGRTRLLSHRHPPRQPRRRLAPRRRRPPPTDQSRLPLRCRHLQHRRLRRLVPPPRTREHDGVGLGDGRMNTHLLPRRTATCEVTGHYIPRTRTITGTIAELAAITATYQRAGPWSR